MFEEERLQLMSEYVQNNTRATVQELCTLFGVSESTIRRDLKELEKRNLIKRTHGGAVNIDFVSFEPSYNEKTDKHSTEKELIAKKAAELIEDGDSIIIDAGTTTFYLAAELSKFKNLTVVTNSITLAQQLANIKDINIVTIGGMLRKNTMAVVGPIAEESLNSIRVDKAFIGTNAIDISAGLTTPNMLEASIKQKMISVANKVYILADNSKFERVSFAKFGKLSDIDACITGDNLPESIKRDFQSKNIKLYLVK